MTRSQVEEKLEQFLELLDEQQVLREELLALKMGGKRATEEAVREALQRQTDMVAEIERIRMEQMLPILDELARFLNSRQVQGVAD